MLKLILIKQFPFIEFFWKQQIDQLTANQWLVPSDRLKQQLIKLSIQESYPCTFTSMLAYELDYEQKQEVERRLKRKETRRKSLLGRKNTNENVQKIDNYNNKKDNIANDNNNDNNNNNNDNNDNNDNVDNEDIHSQHGQSESDAKREELVEEDKMKVKKKR